MGVANGSGWNLWVWLAGGGCGCGWNLWVWLVGVVVRRYIDFLVLLIPTPLVSALFAAASLLFGSLKKCFLYSSSSSQFYACCYILEKRFSIEQNRQLLSLFHLSSAIL